MSHALDRVLLLAHDPQYSKANTRAPTHMPSLLPTHKRPHSHTHAHTHSRARTHPKPPFRPHTHIHTRTRTDDIARRRANQLFLGLGATLVVGGMDGGARVRVHGRMLQENSQSQILWWEKHVGVFSISKW